MRVSVADAAMEPGILTDLVLDRHYDKSAGR